MKSRKLTGACIVSLIFLIAACGGNSQPAQPTDPAPATTAENNNAAATSETHGNEIKPGDVTLTTPLKADWVTKGKEIYNLKCQACHKLTDERLVGPGWKDVTKRREPHWIMNMITNVDMMLEKDPEAQKLLEQCLVRMPNQNISQDEAREILEFMRSNDGVK